jgi:hypothetical protein
MLVKPEHQDHVYWQVLVQRATTSRKHHLKLHRQKNYGMLPLAFADRGYIQYGLGVNFVGLEPHTQDNRHEPQYKFQI